MLTLIDLAVAAWLFAAPAGTLAGAAETVASGEDDGSAAKRLVEAGRPGLWAVADVAKTKSGVERGRLFEVMGRFGGPDAEWGLLVEVRKVEPAARAGVIRGIGHLKSPKMLSYIMDALASPDATVRDAGLDALVEQGPRARDRIPALRTSPDPYLRAVAVRYLFRAGTRGMIEPILPDLLKDPAPEVQKEAIPLAVRTRDQVYTSALSRLARGSNEAVALQATDGLVALRRAHAAWELAQIISDRGTLDPVWRRAAAAIRSFGASGLDAYLDALQRADGEKKAALLALLEEGISDAELALVVPMLGDPFAPRAALAGAILDGAGVRGLQAAFLRLPSAPPPLRKAIVALLGARQGESFAARLLELAHTGEERERVPAIDLLGQLGDKAALASLADLLGDPSPAVRAKVATVIAVAGDDAVRTRVLELLHDPEPEVRGGALRGLANATRTDTEVTRAGVHALTDPSEDVRIAAIALLARPIDPMVVAAFRARIPDASDRERVHIAEALAESRLPEAIVLLVDLATDHDPAVKLAATRALTR